MNESFIGSPALSAAIQGGRKRAHGSNHLLLGPVAALQGWKRRGVLTVATGNARIDKKWLVIKVMQGTATQPSKRTVTDKKCKPCIPDASPLDDPDVIRGG